MKYNIPDMSCNHCKLKINNALKEIKGIDSIRIDVDKKMLEIKGAVDKSLVINAIENAGYKAIEIK